MPRKKPTDDDHRVAELTADLQRLRADFENYRKQAEQATHTARETGQAAAVLKLLPVIDNIERAIRHVPPELQQNNWVKGVTGLVASLEKSLASLEVARIDAAPGTAFDPEHHEAIQFDETADGDKEVIADELQAGYTHRQRVIRPAMVKVTKTT